MRRDPFVDIASDTRPSSVEWRCGNGPRNHRDVVGPAGPVVLRGDRLIVARAGGAINSTSTVAPLNTNLTPTKRQFTPSPGMDSTCVLQPSKSSPETRR